jgi:UDP-N-acetylglucosamine:LPS N-acetylglucosamine transferase
MPKVLYVSGSLGLGHVTRDIEIARELRRQIPKVEIFWLAAHPATMYLEQSGEKLVPEADQYECDSIPAERAARQGFRLHLPEYLSNAAPEWEQNERVFKQVIKDGEFDLVIADETYEIFAAMLEPRIHVETPFVAIFDFFGHDAMTDHPIELETVYRTNHNFWTQLHRLFSEEKKCGVFIGEPDDIPPISLGPGLPDRREYTKENLNFVGYVLRFDPKTLSNKAKVRSKLGYGNETLIICSIGGTAVGRELLTLCGQAYEIAKHKITTPRMILVCGPRLAAEELHVPPDVEVREFVPELYKHFAASDLAIVHGGGTTTLELTALKCPFIYFPLEAHFEQQIHVAHRLRRHRAGVGLSYSQVTPESLAETIIHNIGKPVDYLSIPLDGASRTAQIARDLVM